LAVTLQQLLEELPFSPDGHIAVDAHFRNSLEDAVDLYISSREEALGLLYKSQELTKNRSVELEADFEEVAASCGYFSFSLLDFANEMRVYLEILDDLKLEVEERPCGRTWNWLKFWRKYQRTRPNWDNNDPGMRFCTLQPQVYKRASRNLKSSTFSLVGRSCQKLRDHYFRHRFS